MEPTQRAKHLIKHLVHMVISTADTSGKPWVSPVFFVYDEAYNFYWVSSKNALHSENIRHRPEIAIAIFGQAPDGVSGGVYIDALAAELTNESEIKAAIAVLAKRPQPSKFTTNSIADVTDDADWRIYKAAPVASYIRADALVNGQAITVRESIKLF